VSDAIGYGERHDCMAPPPAHRSDQPFEIRVVSRRAGRVAIWTALAVAMAAVDALFSRASVFGHAALFALTALFALQATMAAIAERGAKGPPAALGLDDEAVLLDGRPAVARADIVSLTSTTGGITGTAVRIGTRESDIDLWFAANDDARLFMQRLPDVGQIERFELTSPLSVRRVLARAWEVLVAMSATMWLALGPEPSAASRFLQSYVFAFALLSLGRAPRWVDVGRDGVVLRWLWTKSIVPFGAVSQKWLADLGAPDDLRERIEASVRRRTGMGDGRDGPE
jgi:hypothetical protein